ncbi:tail protein X [Methylomonas sp. EFPC1]|uniref:tail protein X n=1 Tax=Methylomonas sp. EFPC1 TaxID=2812647 RepID=UPI001967DAE9|nr:tail protein X [Methylomonas sp. EFPC1]QSB03232.1 tail protein X [Methylomonas sp. EFPC1]
MTQYRSKAGDVLDAICYKHYAARPGATEAVLEANRGLADIGPVLPAGVIIELPELAPVAPAATVRLWD